MINKCISITLTLFLVLALPKASQALQVGIGASTWYADWKFESKGDQGNDVEFDPTFLYGPIITLGFSPQWSLSGVFLYGKYSQSSEGGGPGDISRFDSDLTLNYSFNRYFKAFAGFKYMGYSFDEGDHAGYGPGLGISLIAPLTDSFFLIGNLSGMYIWGTHDSGNQEYDYTEPGFNAGFAIAYHFASASTVISLGGRYQVFRTKPDNSASDEENQHTFYGVTFSAIYSFSI